MYNESENETSFSSTNFISSNNNSLTTIFSKHKHKPHHHHLNTNTNTNTKKKKKSNNYMINIIGSITIFFFILSCVLFFCIIYHKKNHINVSNSKINPNGLKYVYREYSSYDNNDNGNKYEIIEGTLYIESNEYEMKNNMNWMFLKEKEVYVYVYVYSDPNVNVNHGIEMLEGEENVYDCIVECVCGSGSGVGRRVVIAYPIFHTIVAMSVFAATSIFLYQAENTCKLMGELDYEENMEDNCLVKSDSEECTERKRGGKRWLCSTGCYYSEILSPDVDDPRTQKFINYPYEGFHDTKEQAIESCKIEVKKVCDDHVKEVFPEIEFPPELVPKFGIEEPICEELDVNDDTYIKFD